MKNKKTLMIGTVAVLVLALVACMMVGLNHITKKTDPNATDGKDTTLEGNTITVIVIHADKSEKTFTYTTQKDYLGEVLLAEGLVSGEDGPYGLYIQKVDGEQAKDKAYWCLYIGDTMATTGVSEIVIHDGDLYKLVYTGA